MTSRHHFTKAKNFQKRVDGSQGKINANHVTPSYTSPKSGTPNEHIYQKRRETASAAINLGR